MEVKSRVSEAFLKTNLICIDALFETKSNLGGGVSTRNINILKFKKRFYFNRTQVKLIQSKEAVFQSAVFFSIKGLE